MAKLLSVFVQEGLGGGLTPSSSLKDQTGWMWEQNIFGCAQSFPAFCYFSLILHLFHYVGFSWGFVCMASGFVYCVSSSGIQIGL